MPERLDQGPVQREDPSSELGRLWSRARQRPGLSAARLSALRARVEDRVAQPAWRLGWLRPAPVLALLGASAASAAVGAGIYAWKRASVPAVADPPALAATALVPAPLPPVPPPLASEPGPEPAKPGSPERGGRPPPRPAPSKPNAIVSSTLEKASKSDLGEQARLVARAMELQGQGNTSDALAALEEYRSRFPAGALSQEAGRVRLEALIALGHDEEALRVASELEGRGAELRVVRGELLAKVGRCREALPVLGPLLDSTSLDTRERALFAHAGCLAAQGDFAGSRADLARYLAEFPGGRFAQRAREELAK